MPAWPRAGSAPPPRARPPRSIPAPRARQRSRTPTPLEEISQQVLSDERQERLRVELHPFDGQGLVAQPHDLVAVGIAGAGAHLQAVGEALALDQQRVVAGGLEG